MKIHNFAFFCMATCVTLSLVTSAHAQALFGAVVGNVKDSSDAAIAGAVVILINKETRQERQATTTDTGGFDFATIPPGTYDVRASKPGFASSVRTGLVVSANSTVRADIQLSVGAVNETVTVSATGEILQTDRAEVRQSVDRDQ